MLCLSKRSDETNKDFRQPTGVQEEQDYPAEPSASGSPFGSRLTQRQPEGTSFTNLSKREDIY